ncbi:MAG: glucose-6-phosphate isomerase [Patiriisocius sp.]|jgi:glucose-6-phosphate isomerase
MAFPKINPTTTKSWTKLQQHFTGMSSVKMQELFADETNRKERFSLATDLISLDFSKNRITSETLALLLALAEETKLKEAIQAQFDGEVINETEDRQVLHTALRDFDAMKPEVRETLLQMKDFSEAIIQGTHKGYTGKKITDIVNIGIGGSDLGPAMVTEALSFYKNHLNTHYISNVDGDHVSEVLKGLDSETTLFIIVSKTFTTQETLTNATTVREWFVKQAGEKAIENHFAAVTTNLKAVATFGIVPQNIFTMWNWVGGRYSLWSAVGLSTCCAIGYIHFEQLLKGAHQMDTHFKNRPFSENMPVLLGLLSIWYTNFFEAETEAVLPYTQYLSKFVDYLQQANMESNGKNVDRNGIPVTYQTGPVVWGNTGTNAQHAFIQLLHQGTLLIPTDFILCTHSLHAKKNHQDILTANCLAQTEALLMGTYGETVTDPYRVFQGNKPSNLITLPRLTPESLGALIALYEHKIFVQGAILNIFSFDQFGVELGKTIAKKHLISK